MFAAGDSFDRYVIEVLLGEGGMGAVFRAHDMRLNRRVAIKVLRIAEGKAGGAAAAARLLREARTVASFEHPNAVTIFDVGEAEGSPYIAMELINGKTLRDHIRASAPWQQKARWLVDAGRALGAAHKVGLVHRDVKPENIMVREDGCVKVLDFGIARRVQPPVPEGAAPVAAPAGRKSRAAIMGSPLYMSGEQLSGKAANGRSDQYSWGVSAFHLLSGKTPWGEHRNTFELFAAILHGEPESLREAVPDLPEGVVRVIEQAMSRKPEGRFASMEDAVDALENEILSARSAPPRDGANGAGETGSISPPANESPALVEVVAPAVTADDVGAGRPAAAAGTTSTAVEKDAMVALAPERAGPRLSVLALALVSVLAFAAGVLTPRPAFVGRAPSAASVPGAPGDDGAAARGLRAFREGRDDDAARELRRAAAASPAAGAPRVELALLAWLRHESDPADLDAARAARASLAPEDLRIVDVLAACGDAAAAADCERAATAATTDAPTSALLWLLAAVAHDRAANAADAARDAERATSLDPGLVPAWRERVALAK